MAETKVTLQEMMDGLNYAITKGKVSPGAAVLWAANVVEGDMFCTECHAVPGSVLLGLEYFEDDSIMRGTLQLAPSKLSDYIS